MLRAGSKVRSRSTAVSKSVIVVFAALIIIVTFSSLYLGIENSAKSSSFSISTTVSSISTSSNDSALQPSSLSYPAFESSAQATNTSVGLELQLSINSTLISSGGALAATVMDYNTLQQINNLSSSTDWALKYLTLGSCGTNSYPFGVAFYAGYYSLSNISTAIPLDFAPGVSGCPEESYVSYYVFQPTSTSAELYTTQNGTNVQCCFTTAGQPSPINGTVTINSYWDNSNVQRNLAPGVYTVEGGDEWGQLAILHFAVVALPLPVQVVSVLGPILPYFPAGPTVSITLKNNEKEPITALNATLELPSAEISPNYAFDYQTSTLDPLRQNQTAESTKVLIGAGFETGIGYPLVIWGTLVGGTSFNYTQQVEIVPPNQTTTVSPPQQ